VFVSQTAYLVTLFGFFSFFAAWEAGDPRLPFAGAAERRLHLLRNAGLFAVLMFVTNAYFALDGPLLDFPPFAYSHGLLSGLSLGVPLQAVLGVVLLDLYEYGWHRLSHRLPWLWRLHRVHHSEAHLDVSTSMRFHPVETLLSLGFRLCVLGLLGLPLWVEGLRAVLDAPFALSQHANVRFPAWLERWGRWIVITPGLHRIHHSIDRRDYDLNFGSLFSCWDRMFGTWRPAANVEQVGLAGFEDSRWQTLPGMLTAPLR